MMEQMSMVVFSVSVACQSEEAGNRDNQNRRAVKRVDVSMYDSHWISNQSIASNR